MPIDFDNEVARDFQAQAGNIVERLRRQLLALESSPGDAAAVSVIASELRTLSNGAGFIGLAAVAELCQHAEAVINAVRPPVDAQLLNVMHQALDELGCMFQRIEAGLEPTPASTVVGMLGALMVEPAASASTPARMKPVEGFEELLASIQEHPPAVTDQHVSTQTEGVSTATSGKVPVHEHSVDEYRRDRDKPPTSSSLNIWFDPLEATDANDDAELHDTDAEFSDDDFEALLDQLYGVGKVPGLVPQVSDPGQCAAVVSPEPTEQVSATVPSLLVRIDSQSYALPMRRVQTVVDAATRPVHVVDSQESVVVGDQVLPLFYPGEWLVEAAQRSAAPDRHVVVIHAGNRTVALAVDQLNGQEDIVIQPLGRWLRGSRGLAGAAVTTDGAITLMLDIPELIDHYAQAA